MKVTCELCETVLHLGSATVVCVPCLDRLRSAERPDTAAGALACGAPNTASAKSCDYCSEPDDALGSICKKCLQRFMERSA